MADTDDQPEARQEPATIRWATNVRNRSAPGHKFGRADAEAVLSHQDALIILGQMLDTKWEHFPNKLDTEVLHPGVKLVGGTYVDPGSQAFNARGQAAVKVLGDAIHTVMADRYGDKEFELQFVPVTLQPKRDGKIETQIYVFSPTMMDPDKLQGRIARHSGKIENELRNLCHGVDEKGGGRSVN